MNTVNLTTRQQKFFDYFNEYHRDNGTYPTLSQGGRDMKCCTATISAMYGALLIKGAFTSGKAIVTGNKPRRNTKPSKAVNLMEVKIEPKSNLRKRYTPKAIAQAITKLIENGDPAAKELAKMLGL
jgi:hypothetical protein